MRLFVRRADIDPKLREQLELFGEVVIALALSAPFPASAGIGGPVTKPSDGTNAY
jgi:hypothetical protein